MHCLIQNIKFLTLIGVLIALSACAGGGGGGGGSSSSGGGGAPYITSVSGTTYVSATYPGNWTTTGTVTPPSTSPITETYSDGSTVIEYGTSSAPFLQTSLSGNGVSDPNAYVTSSTATYNLNWGTPDKSGPTYAALFPSASTHLSSNLTYMGRTVSGQGVVGPTLVQPSSDVLAAWNKGWTGSGKNILTVDSYSSVSSCNDATSCHGITTMMISDLVAPGATKFGVDSGLGTAVKDINGTAITSSTKMDVVNMSFYVTSAADAALYVNRLNGTTAITNTVLTQAVITKSAGNNSTQDTYSGTNQYLNKALIDDASTASRLLIVGALNKNGTTGSPASIASYSNYAGSNASAQSRFVVANGNAPYANGGVAINGNSISGYNSVIPNYGTSYAAPVVAGYAAVVMQKFPNLTAASTSNIILDTARTDTLSCSPSCDPTIYGKGEASLSRALAPVGRLR